MVTATKAGKFRAPRNELSRFERFKLWALVRMSHKQKMAFTKYLAVLLRSGLAVDEVLSILNDQSKGALKAIIASLRDAVQNGDRLADGFAKYPHIFNQVYINLVAAGEAAGSLNANMEHLAEQLDKDRELRQKIKGAVMYPIVILTFAVILCVLIVVFILPNISQVFESLDVKLPATTRALLWLAKLFENHGRLLAVIAVSTVAAIAILRKIPFVKPFSHTALLYVPIIGSIAKKTNLARLMRLMGTMIKSGMTLDEVLPLSRNVLENVRYRKALKQVQIEVGQGNTLAASMSKFPSLFPSLFVRMTKVGEESGTLGDTFLYLTEFYEGDIDEATKNLSTLLEPFLLVAIGLMVGTVALSIVSPIYGIVSSI